MPSATFTNAEASFSNGAPVVENWVFTRALTPMRFFTDGNGAVSPVHTRAERQAILPRAICSRCRRQPVRTRDVRFATGMPGRSNASVARDSTAEEESPPPETPEYATEPIVQPVITREFQTLLFPQRLYIPVVNYLTKAHIVFLIDDSKQMAPFWTHVGDCVTQCMSTIIDEAEADYVSLADYFPYGDGQEEEEREVVEERSGPWKEFPTMSLQFLRSSQRLTSILYSEAAASTFNAVSPHLDGAPLGSRILEVLADLFPEPRLGAPDDVPIQIIIPTTGYTTDRAEDTVNALLTGLDALNISDDKIHITIYQVGSNPFAAARLERYESVYNNWAGQRDLVYAERSAAGEPGAIGNGVLSSRRLLRAVSRGLELSGRI